MTNHFRELVQELLEHIDNNPLTDEQIEKSKNGLRRIGKNKNIIKVLGEHMDETKYISERLDDQINWYDTKSQKHQKCYKWYKN